MLMNKTASRRMVNDLLQLDILGQRPGNSLLCRRLGSLHVRQPTIYELVHGHPG